MNKIKAIALIAIVGSFSFSCEKNTEQEPTNENTPKITYTYLPEAITISYDDSEDDIHETIAPYEEVLTDQTHTLNGHASAETNTLTLQLDAGWDPPSADRVVCHNTNLWNFIDCLSDYLNSAEIGTPCGQDLEVGWDNGFYLENGCD